MALDPFAGAPILENAFASQAVTPGSPLLPAFDPNQNAGKWRGTEAVEPAAPPADPFAGAPIVPDDPFAGAPVVDPKTVRGYDMAKLQATSIEELRKDKHDFNPVDFYARNTDALLADPASLEKVEAIFEDRDKERMGPVGLAKAIVTAPLHPIDTAKTVGKAVKGGVEFIGTLAGGVKQVFATGGEVAGHLSEGDLTGAAKGISEAAAAFDTAQQRWVSILTDKALPALGAIPRGKTARERLAFDADFKRAENRAAEGNGTLAKELGTDQEGLKASGVILDTNAIEKLSVITDPVNLVPIGGVIGVVGRGGKFVLGKAVSPAVAETFAKGVNGAMAKAAAWPVAKTGAAIEKAGTLLETKGPAIAKSATARTAGTVAAVMSGDFTTLAAALAAPTAAKLVGKATAATGRGIQAAAPAFGHVASEGVKGAAEGAVLAVPLFLGSDEQEREGLVGMIAGAGMLRGGLAGAGVAKGVAEKGESIVAQSAQNKLAKPILDRVEQGPPVESPAYGTDTALDIAHQEHSASLPQGEQSLLSRVRELFRDSGVEVYALDTKNFVNNVPNVAGASMADGFFAKRGQKLNPDGTSSPTLQILLNKDTNGIGHELYHAFKSLDPQGATALEAHISKTWTPEERAWLSDTYNSALNGGKPKEQWTAHRNEAQILEEAAAEVFGRVVNATDLTGVRPSIVKRAATFASTILDKMGHPLAGKGLPQGPGVSALGVRPGTAELKISQDFLADMTRRAQRGELGQSTPGKPLEAGSLGPISRRPDAAPLPTPSETPAAPATPKPAAAAPAPVPLTTTITGEPLVVTPVPPVAAPKAPAAENIRVTPEEQAQFAADRAKVTNSEQGAAQAAKTGKVPQVQAVNDAMAAGHAVEIVHKGVIREGGPSPEAPVARDVRRAEQEAAYVQEAMGAVPDSVREPHQKLFFGTRWIKGGKQLTARSVDKALANIKNAVDMAAEKKVALPYEVDAAGKLTETGWHEAVTDLKDYWSNQDRGFRGDGKPLAPETRTRDVGQSIPAEDPAGPVALISTERTDFLNLVQGLNIPETTKSPSKVPGNVKGQILAEQQGRRPATPAGFTPEDVKAKTFKPIEGELTARSIMEVNPLRNELRAAGAPVEKLIEVTENIKQENIESVTPRPDVTGKGGSTDITRAGFSVKGPAEGTQVAKRLEEKRKAGVPITDIVRRQVQQEVEREARSGKTLAKGEAAGFFSVKNTPEVQEVINKVARGEKPGETFNLDGTVFKATGDRKLDVVPLVSENFAAEALTPEALQALVDKHPEVAKNPNVKVGVFKLSDGRVSADLNVLVDQSNRAASLEFAKTNNQEALYDLAKNEAVPAGGTGEAKSLSPKEVAEAVKNLTAEKVTKVGDTQKIVDMPGDEWIKTTQGFKGGLTSEAYRLGLSLTDRADLAKLAEARTKAEAAAKEAMASGDLDGAMAPITKAQFFREAWEAAQGIASAKNGLARLEEFKGAKPPLIPEGAAFSVKTDSGREAVKKGFDFKASGDASDRMIEVFKGGGPVGYINAMVVRGNAKGTPKTAEVVMTNLDKEFRGQGLGETLYREIFQQLKEDGIELVGGMVVAPEPVAIRNKIFGGKFENLESGGEPISLSDALNTLAELKKPPGARSKPELLGVDVVNRITPESKFSVKGPEKDFEVVWRPRAEGKTVLRQKVSAISAEEAQRRANLPKTATVVSVEPTFKVERTDAELVEDSGKPVGIRPLTREERGMFSVRRKSETKAERLDREETERLAKYNVPVEQKPKGDKPTGWVLPNGKFVGLDTDYHQSWLGENSDRLNKEFGTSFPKDATIDDRMTAINKGFVRAREYNGKMTIEMNQKFFKGATKRAVEDLLTKHASDLDSVNLHLLNDQGLVVDQVAQRLFDAENPQAAALGMLERVKTGATAGREPTAIQRARAMGGDEMFSVKPEEKVVAAAWKDRKGKVHTGPFHAAIYEDLNMSPLAGQDNARIAAGEGFVTDTGRFVDREEAAKIGKASGQLQREVGRGSVEVAAEDFNNFGEGVEEFFSVKPPTDKEVTAALSEDKKPFVGAHRDLEPGTPVGLRIDIPAFMRHGTYVVTVHEKAKGGSVGKRIGYDSVATVDNPTFFSNEKGAEKIREGAAKFPIATVEGEFNPAREVPESGGEWTDVGYNPTKHSYFYEKGTETPVVSGEQAVSAGNSVFVKNAKFGNADDYAFAVKKPKEEPLTPETAEAGAEKFNRIRAAEFPEAKPQRFVRDDDGKLLLDKKGKLIPADEEARLHETPLAEEAVATHPELDPHEAISDALSERIVTAAEDALKNPDAKKGLTWYDDAVALIKNYYGDNAEKFAQLLAATSPRNGVQVNFAYAVEAFNNFMAGKYDRNVKDYLGLREQWKTGEGADLKAWEADPRSVKAKRKWRGDDSDKAKALRNNFLSWAVEKHDLLPLREGVMVDGELTATLYGMHTFAVLDVLADTWLQDVEGPKVRNFLDNLTGKGHEATIDIWATRFLMRLAQSEKSLKGQWRVAPPAGEGISNANFTLAQKAFRKAADKMGVHPDALQALVWFSEKHLWEENNWTGFVGAAKSDYAYWLRGLEQGDIPGTHNIPESLRLEAQEQGKVERAKAEEARLAREKLLSGISGT